MENRVRLKNQRPMVERREKVRRLERRCWPMLLLRLIACAAFSAILFYATRPLLRRLLRWEGWPLFISFSVFYALSLASAARYWK